MPTFYNFTQDNLIYSFDDIFVPADLFREGQLFVWGSNSFGKLGTNDTTSRSTPVTTFASGVNWKQVSLGESYTAAIKTDGTLWVWGGNSYGSLGTNDSIVKSTPVTTFAGGTNWKQVSCGVYHTAAIKTDGTLWVWGYNTLVSLGTNDLTDRSTPVTTFSGGTNWRQVSCGEYHTAAIKTDGTLWVWGYNSTQQLGVGFLGSITTPVTTFAGGTNWKQISCGSGHSAAIKTDGTLWVWGSNNNAQLGVNDNSSANKSTPVTTFAGGTNWKQVSCGGIFTAAIKTDGTLWVWGGNSNAQLGVNDVFNRSTPVTTFAGGTNWRQVSCGYVYTSAVKTDGTLWVWGRNIDAQLGVFNTMSPISTPVTTFAGGTNWRQVSSAPGFSGSHTISLTYSDSVL